MQNSKILVALNGQWLSESDFDGLADAVLTIQNTDNTTLGYSFGSSVRLRGAAFQIIKSELLDAANPFDKSVEIAFYDQCCESNNAPNRFFVGRIAYTDLELCTGTDGSICEVTCSFKDATPRAQNVDCLRSWIISKEGLLPNGQRVVIPAYEMPYYVEARPKANTVLIIILAAVLNRILSVFAVIQFILNLFGGRGLLDGITQVFNRWLFPERAHIAVYVQTYLQNACVACGMQLESTLFTTGHLHRIMRVDAANIESDDETNVGRAWDLNRPLINTIELLDSFAALNVAYRITDTSLIVEHNTFFEQQATTNIWIDATQRTINSLCVQGTGERPLAGRIYQYSADGSERVGMELQKPFSRVANYNVPTNPLMAGIETVTIPYALARSLNDGYEKGVFRAIQSSQFLQLLTGINLKADRVILSNGTFLTPKLFEATTSTIPGGYYNASNIRVPLTNSVSYLNTENQQVSYQIALQLCTLQNQTLPFKTAYDALLVSSDPRGTSKPQMNFTLEIDFNCNDLLDIANTTKYITFPYNGQIVTGIVETIEVNFTNHFFTIKGRF